jgi:CDP-diacylglycerol---serine O-phosphatidyltransferase
MSRRERVFAVLPTLLTLGNAFCGFAAITYAAKVGPDAPEAAGGHLFHAAVYIFLAMFFDALDGRVARWANQTSEFGAQLDSLCDAISFGVAPAFLMLQASREYHPRVQWIIGVLYVVCAVLRLARFNVEEHEEESHDSFRGLPSPAAAGVVASFPLAMLGVPRMADPNEPNISRITTALGQFLEFAGVHLLPWVTLAVACLMVSRFRYVHVFNQLFTGQRNHTHLLRIVFAVAAVFLVREMAVLLIFCYFAFSTPAYAFWTHWIAPYLPSRSVSSS